MLTDLSCQYNIKTKMIQIVGNKIYETSSVPSLRNGGFQRTDRGHTSQPGNQQVHKDLNTK